jgi:hypothetical protein
MTRLETAENGADASATLERDFIHSQRIALQKYSPEKNEKFNLPFLAFAFFSGQQDRGLLDAISRDLLDCPCRF